MSHTPHELADEFPQDKAVIHDLKLANAHFASLADSYHEVNRQIHRIETEIEPTSDEFAEGLKKRRLALLDELGSIIRSAKATAG